MNYFYWRQIIPLIIMFAYLYITILKTGLNPLRGYVIISFASAFVLYLYPKSLWISLEWTIYLFISYWYSLKKRCVLFSITYSMLSATFGSWIYEIPYFHPLFMFYDSLSPLYINTQIIAGIFMFGMLIKERVEINKRIVCTFILFIISEVFFYIKVTYYRMMLVDLTLFARLPIMVLLLSFLTGLNKSIDSNHLDDRSRGARERGDLDRH